MAALKWFWCLVEDGLQKCDRLFYARSQIKKLLTFF